MELDSKTIAIVIQTLSDKVTWLENKCDKRQAHFWWLFDATMNAKRKKTRQERIRAFVAQFGTGGVE